MISAIACGLPSSRSPVRTPRHALLATKRERPVLDRRREHQQTTPRWLVFEEPKERYEPRTNPIQPAPLTPSRPLDGPGEPRKTLLKRRQKTLLDALKGLKEGALRHARASRDPRPA